ncbi:MAG: DUF2029 domain-containing protein [Clostridia bacterium]|nr:DUF2029 domain-containing protein [Clostridia bacterium]
MKKNTAPKKKTELSSVFILVFLILFGLCFIAMLAMSLKTRGESFLQTLFFADNSTNRDFFMDFFNPLRDAKDADVFARGSINTPLACLIFFLFSHMIPSSVTETTFSQRYAMQANQQAIVIYYVFLTICLVSFAFMLRAYLKGAKNKALATVLSFAFLFIYPLFYCVERGNMALLAMICTAFFVFFHDSENDSVRNFSLLVFAFGAALKLYPIVFILLPVHKKRYKDLLKTAIYFLIFFLVPAVFYHFGADLLVYFKNLVSYGETHKVGFSLTSVSVSSLVTLLGGGKVVGEIACVVTCILAAAASFLVPKDWQRYALLAYCIVNIRIVSSIFVLVFFLIPFIVFISAQTKKRMIDWLYLLLFSLILLPLPCFWYFHPEKMQSLFVSLHVSPILSMNQLIAMPAVQLLFLFLCLEGLINFINLVRDGASPLSFFGGPEKRKRKAPSKPAGKNDLTVADGEGA